MLSDLELTNAKTFMAFVDFEKIPLHSVAILVAERRLICATRGPEPFMDVDFVLRQLARIEGASSVTDRAADRGLSR
jgi:hypothetical protein